MPVLYVVGQNAPGFMPDNEPSGPHEWDDAVEVLIADLRQYADELGENADPDPDYDRELSLRLHTLLWDGLGIDLAVPDDLIAREQTGGVEILFEGRVFYILPDVA